MVLAHPDVPAKIAAGADRLRQGQSRQAADRNRRTAALLRPDRGVDQQARRHKHFLRALRADDAGHPGCDRRPRPAHHSRGPGGARSHRGRQALPLAVTSAKRLAAFPNVPTVAEIFPGFDFAGWWVLAAADGRSRADPAARQHRARAHPQGSGGGGEDDQRRLHQPRRRHHAADPRLRAAAARGLGHAGQGDRTAAGVSPSSHCYARPIRSG